MSVIIRQIVSADYASWRELWDRYCEFYRVVVPNSVTENTWNQMLLPNGTIGGRIATLNGAAVGFSTFVVHATTWELRPICYLEDLFVSQTARGAGVGRAIIDHLIAEARTRDWARVYWHTESSNATARRLYDRYTAADEYVRYVVRIDATAERPPQ